jgi:hypothetical protein
MNDPGKSRKRNWRLVALIASLALLLEIGVGFLLWRHYRISRKQNDPKDIALAHASIAPVLLTDFAYPETQRWGSVPKGTQVMDNVTFVCDGAIRTAGLTSIRAGKGYPTAIIDIPVHLTGSKIHLLQAAENKSGMPELAPYGRLVFHFANGETRILDLLFGVHGRDWVSSPMNVQQPVLDPNTKLSWTFDKPGGLTVRFYHTTFGNPLPKIPIVSVDFISTLRIANLLLFGMTVDNDPIPLATPFQPNEPQQIQSTSFQLQDQRGQPLRDGKLSWVGSCFGRPIEFPPFPSDARGRVQFEIPPHSLESIHYTATSASGQTGSGDLTPDDTGLFPAMTTVQLK